VLFRSANYSVTVRNGVLSVVDTTAPAIVSVTPSLRSLWPPNKRLVPVTISVAATDAADPHPSCTVTSVSANEGTAADRTITGSDTVLLRADRNGAGSGRIYTVTVTCTDASRNAAAASTVVVVPHDDQ